MREGIILYVLAVLGNLGMLGILNLDNRGEAGEAAGEASGEAGGDAGGEKIIELTQSKLNAMMADHKRGLQTELSTTSQQLKEYQEKLQQYETAEETRKQSKLEEQQEYEKLKENFSTKENEYKNLLNQKDMSIRDMQITNALTSEIINQNAHSDAVQLIKSLAEVGEDGSVTISGKDANGIEQKLPVGEGVKQFLKDRPHLVKATGMGGGGTSASAASGGTNVNTDPMADANELQEAMRSGDRKRILEIKAKIGAKRASTKV